MYICYVPHLLYPFIPHLGCFPVLPAVDMGVQIPFRVVISFHEDELRAVALPQGSWPPLLSAAVPDSHLESSSPPFASPCQASLSPMSPSKPGSSFPFCLLPSPGCITASDRLIRLPVTLTHLLSPSISPAEHTSHPSSHVVLGPESDTPAAPGGTRGPVANRSAVGSAVVEGA